MRHVTVLVLLVGFVAVSSPASAQRYVASWRFSHEFPQTEAGHRQKVEFVVKVSEEDLRAGRLMMQDEQGRVYIPAALRSDYHVECFGTADLDYSGHSSGRGVGVIVYDRGDWGTNAQFSWFRVYLDRVPVRNGRVYVDDAEIYTCCWELPFKGVSITLGALTAGGMPESALVMPPKVIEAKGIEVRGVVLVPVRPIADWLEASINTEPKAKRITLREPTVVITLTLGSSVALVGGGRHKLDAPATERAGVTYVPLRFLAQASGASYAWDAKAREATLTRKGSYSALKVSVP